MEQEKQLLDELIGTTVLVKTHLGMGTRDVSLGSGEYKGALLGFDGKFIKLEYELTKFSKGGSEVTKAIVFINTAYIISLEPYKSKELR